MKKRLFDPFMLNRNNTVALPIVFFLLCVAFVAHAQEKTLVQIKTFDEQLKPLANQEVSFNGKIFIPIGSKGSAFVEVSSADLPPKSVTVKNEGLEAESWNYSKGVVEIIIRKKSYKVHHWTIVDHLDKPVANLPIVYKGRRSQSVVSNDRGQFELQLALDEKVTDASQFTMSWA
jgi:hypothetical protein